MKSFTQSEVLYDYDNLDRLNYENPDDGTFDSTYTYNYDKLGNRLSVNQVLNVPQTYTYAPDSNKLLSIDQNSRTYDNNGNTLSTDSGSFNYTYNQANRMDVFKVGHKEKGFYTHNGIGQRVYKSEILPKGITDHSVFIYDENGQLVSESDYDKGSQLLLVKDTIWLANRPVAQVRSEYDNGVMVSQEIYYILTDHLNTPRKVLNNSGIEIWKWDSLAFGNNLPHQDVDGDGVAFEFNLRFPGQYFDKESGLHYNYFRDYEPGTGRYVESDPIGLKGGMNTFNYVSSRVINASDSLGLFDYGDGLYCAASGNCQNLCFEMPHLCEPPEPAPEPNPYLDLTNIDIRCYLDCRKSAKYVCPFIAVGFGSVCFTNPKARGVGVFTGRTLHRKCSSAGFGVCNALYHKVCAPRCHNCE